jgi:phage shock protein E
MTRAWCLAAVLAIAACGKSESPAQTQGVPAQATPAAAAPAKRAKDPAAARAAIAEGAVVIDVRSAEEFADDHLPNATNVPLDEIATRTAEVEKLVGGDKAKTIVLYCGTGNRAGKAQQQLEAAGFTQIINGGGLDDLL